MLMLEVPECESPVATLGRWEGCLSVNGRGLPLHSTPLAIIAMQ